jgi:hypothetical protein
MTTMNGDSTSPDHSHDGKMVKLAGRMDDVCSGMLLGPLSSLPAPGTYRPPTSTTLRMPIMISMIQSWKRSTMSAQASWNMFSFSKRLNTALLISTNWFDSRSVKRALEYELTATFSAMTW